MTVISNKQTNAVYAVYIRVTFCKWFFKACR